MQSFFDKFTPAPAEFRPKRATEMFALRLAQRLGDVSAVRHYVDLADHYSEARLISAYRCTLRANGNGDRARRFHVELEQTHANGDHPPRARLISIRVERRAIAAAIFQSNHLEYADAKQLSSAHEKAVGSAVGFINWMLSHFPVESAALELIPNGHEFQRRVLHSAVSRTLRDRMLPIWEIPKVVLLEGCGYPPPKSRSELRGVATTIWPILTGTHARVFIQDAAILGLHVQIERLFIIN